MTRWEVWRQDDNGNQYKVSAHDDRVEALAQAFVFEARGHKQVYWVEGPAVPACRTTHDLYQRAIAAGATMDQTGRTLSEFLRAWLKIGALNASRQHLDLDTVAATLVAAASAEPLPILSARLTTDHPPIKEPLSYQDWQRVLTSQIADLTGFAEPPTPHAFLARGVARAFPGSDHPGKDAEVTPTWGHLARLAICGKADE